MKALLTAPIRKQLIANFQITQTGLEEVDHVPVLKCFTPDAPATWLFTEYDEAEDLLFGLCDLGIGFPELGYVSLQELQSMRGALGLPVERDAWFETEKPLSLHAQEARLKGRVSALY